MPGAVLGAGDIAVNRMGKGCSMRVRSKYAPNFCYT